MVEGFLLYGVGVHPGHGTVDEGEELAVHVLPYPADTRFPGRYPAVPGTELAVDLSVLERFPEHGGVHDGLPLDFLLISFLLIYRDPVKSMPGQVNESVRIFSRFIIVVQNTVWHRDYLPFFRPFRPD